MDDKIVFLKNLAGYSTLNSIGKVTHILCEKGGFSFLQNHIRYNVSEGDLVIFLNGVIVSDIHVSMDFKGIILEFSESFFYTDNVRNNYIIIGHLSLLKDPVMKLNEEQFKICRSSLILLEEKLMDKENLFHE